MPYTKLPLSYIYLTGMGFVFAVCRSLQNCNPFSMVSFVQFMPPCSYMNYMLFGIRYADTCLFVCVCVCVFALLRCWISLSCFFTNITTKCLIYHRDYYHYWVISVLQSLTSVDAAVPGPSFKIFDWTCHHRDIGYHLTVCWHQSHTGILQKLFGYRSFDWNWSLLPPSKLTHLTNPAIHQTNIPKCTRL